MLKMRTKPRVSVIIPAHNAGEFLRPAIQSILDQTFSDFELIVVNDGSKDNTRTIVQSFVAKDARVRLISYRQNKGESAAANIGFQKSCGEYIARMDADDIAHPTRLEKQVAFMDQHPAYIVVGTQAQIINEFDQVIGHKKFPTTHEEIYQEYGIMHPMLHPSIMVRRAMIPWKNKLWANEAEPNDDYYTLFTFLNRGKFANLPQKLMSYRMHSNNKSMQHIKKKFMNSLRIRTYAVRHLGYKLNSKMILSAIGQSFIVFSLPEFLTSGLYFFIKGIKPFDQAFPFVKKAKESLVPLISQPLRWEYIFPAFIAAFVHSLFFRNNS